MNTMDLGLAALVEDDSGLAAVGAAVLGVAALGAIADRSSRCPTPGSYHKSPLSEQLEDDMDAALMPVCEKYREYVGGIEGTSVWMSYMVGGVDAATTLRAVNDGFRREEDMKIAGKFKYDPQNELPAWKRKMARQAAKLRERERFHGAREHDA
jgi:hypothetical protein